MMNLKYLFIAIALIAFPTTTFACNFEFGSYQMQNFKLTPDSRYLICGGDKRTDHKITSTSIIDKQGEVVEFQLPEFDNQVGGFTIDKISPDSNYVTFSGIQKVVMDDNNQVTKLLRFIAPTKGGPAMRIHPELAPACAIDVLKFSPDASKIVFSVSGSRWYDKTYNCPAKYTGYFSMSPDGKNLVRIHKEFNAGILTGDFMISPDSKHVLHYDSLNMQSYPSAQVSSIHGGKSSKTLVSSSDYMPIAPKSVEDFMNIPVRILGFMNNSEIVTTVTKDGITEELVATKIDGSRSHVLLENQLETIASAGKSLSMGISTVTPSPDGKYLLISRKGPGFKNDLVVIPTTRGELVELLGGFTDDFVFADNGQAIVYSRYNELIKKTLGDGKELKYDLVLRNGISLAKPNDPAIPSLYLENGSIFHLTSLRDEGCGGGSAYSLMRTASHGGITTKLSGRLRTGSCGIVGFGLTKDKSSVIYLSYERSNDLMGFYKVPADGSSPAVRLFSKNY